MEIERKENQKECSICEGTTLVNVTAGWKNYSFWCPSCHRKGFLAGIKNVNLSESEALSLIKSFGKPGDG